MEINNGVLEVMQGEQFSRMIGGIKYDQCSQIVLVLYQEANQSSRTYFVKTEDVQYPGAQIITKTEDPDLQLRIDITKEITESLALGNYHMEAQRVISGVKAPILKSRKIFMNLIKSEL